MTNKPKIIDTRPQQATYRDLIPPDLQEFYDRADNDTDLLSLQKDMKLIEARMMQLSQRLNTNESGKAWATLDKEMTALREHIRNQDMTAASRSLSRIQKLINDEANREDVWKQIVNMMNVRKQLMEAERRRIVDLQSMIDRKTALHVMAKVLQIITENVKDKSAVRAVQKDIKRLIKNELSP
jgi:hypothetical protein